VEKRCKFTIILSRILSRSLLLGYVAHVIPNTIYCWPPPLYALELSLERDRERGRLPTYVLLPLWRGRERA